MSKRKSFVPTLSVSTNNIGQCGKHFRQPERAQKSQNRSHGYQRRAFTQHQQQHLSFTRAQRHANSDLLAALRNRIRGDPRQSDRGQYQAEHSNSAVSIHS